MFKKISEFIDIHMYPLTSNARTESLNVLETALLEYKCWIA